MSEELPTIDHRIWGKSRNLDDPYPLIWHLLDAAAMAGALWDLYLTDNQRAVLADGLNTTQTHARALLVFWAGLHDLGKAAHAFQRKAEKAFAVKDDPAFPEAGDGLIGHATASQLAAATQLAGLGYVWEKGEWESGSACRVAQILGAHHGLFSGRVKRDHET